MKLFTTVYWVPMIMLSETWRYFVFCAHACVCVCVSFASFFAAHFDSFSYWLTTLKDKNQKSWWCNQWQSRYTCFYDIKSKFYWSTFPFKLHFFFVHALSETREQSLSKTRCFLGNLSYDIDDDSLKEAFKHCGEITDIHWLTDKSSGKFFGKVLRLSCICVVIFRR